MTMNSWYFEEHGDEMIRGYKKSVSEYKKKMQTLPHEENDFEIILLEPQDYAEAVFAAYCFSFLKDGTDFLTVFDKKMQEAGEPLQTRKKLAYRFMDVSLGWGTESIIKHYLTKLFEYRPDLGIKNELKNWTLVELKRILQDPKTEAEVDLCRKYIECLSQKEAEKERKIQEQAAFEESIQNYLERLEHRQGAYEKIKKSGATHSALLDILWNPKTREELQFCISYFGFQDDIKFISEVAKDGKIKHIDLSAVTDAIFNEEEYFQKPANQAQTLYDLTVLEQTNNNALMHAIQEKGGYSSLPTVEYDYFKEWLDAQIILGISREEIAKGYSSEALSRFNLFAKELHQRYLSGMMYDEDTPATVQKTSLPKTKEDEVREYAEKRSYQYVKTLVE